jgi:hypothetical protein
MEKIKYLFPAGNEVTASLEGGSWSILSGPKEALLKITEADETIPVDYYPTPWHRAQAVARKLGGKVVGPEPDFESVPGRVY